MRSGTISAGFPSVTMRQACRMCGWWEKGMGLVCVDSLGITLTGGPSLLRPVPGELLPPAKPYLIQPWAGPEHS